MTGVHTMSPTTEPLTTTDASESEMRFSPLADVARYWWQCFSPIAAKDTQSSGGSDTATHKSEEDDEEDEEEEEAYREEDGGEFVCEYEYEGDEDQYEYRYVRVQCESPRGPEVSGLPLVCSNCGVSFFSLLSMADEYDSYCSGECKWSVIMYREMDRRMLTLRARQMPTSCKSSYAFETDPGASKKPNVMDEVVACR